MGYLNPILRYGRDRFLADAAGVGVDGLILPEVPLEEHDLFGDAIAASGLAWVQLVTPASSDGRIRRIDRVSGGFLYCVSLNGVTGARMAAIDAAYLHRVRAAAHRNPVLAGFGIATPADARAMCGILDGVVVGSALLRRVLAGESETALRTWVGGLRDAMRPPY
jgi:tryptophan synthase alpha chain